VGFHYSRRSATFVNSRRCETRWLDLLGSSH
jgi:hypothetical protein